MLVARKQWETEQVIAQYDSYIEELIKVKNAERTVLKIAKPETANLIAVSAFDS